MVVVPSSSVPRSARPPRVKAVFCRATGRTVRARTPGENLVLSTLARRADTEPWRSLCYQLLTAVAGTAIEAARSDASLAVVIVHEFRMENINESSRSQNAEDFKSFVGVLCNTPATDVTPGRLYGPVAPAAAEHLPRPVEMFIGKAQFDWTPA